MALPCRVVIIDDNEDLVSTLAELLEACGHEVRVALDGGHGLAVVRAMIPHVVLCDLCLPDVDGLTLARMLRDAAGPGTTLVAMTGYATREDERKALDAGFDVHLAKPFGLGTVSGILERAAGAAEGAEAMS